jgi:hypothetical protein
MLAREYYVDASKLHLTPINDNTFQKFAVLNHEMSYKGPTFCCLKILFDENLFNTIRKQP